ncbi:hypothetical protein [Celeribacter indicus]|uniref:Lipoprotein n=1 Tax=Celeribacter indicus TaxID=1208324 RepID=A0A0B5DYX7_9RHOB|nr:hypothetical protein [Celeribacter indicus]AJE46385.1 hypothetical protein P73_1670 [Celeribacter indicus]SDW55299.1 hypothetical protein SAMN05443573_104225 [Celeribacter indicus]
MSRISPLLVPLLCLSLTACRISEDDVAPPPVAPAPPGSGTGDDQRTYEDYNRVHDLTLDVAAAQDLTGHTDPLTRDDIRQVQDTAEMSGIYAIAAESLLDTRGAFVGEMSMTANFGTGEVSGKLHNNHIDSAYFPVPEHAHGQVTPLSGEVTYAGSITEESDTGIAAISANGTGVLSTAANEKYELYVDMDGNFYRVDKEALVSLDIDQVESALAAVGGIEGNVNILDDGDATLYDLDGAYAVCETTVCAPR